MDHQYRENGTRNMYSNHDQMRAYVENNQKIYLIDLSIEQSIKLDMNWFDVRIAFPSGLVRSYLDFFCPLITLIGY